MDDRNRVMNSIKQTIMIFHPERNNQQAQVEFLTHLCIPERVLFSAEALYHFREGRYHEAYMFCVKAEEYYTAQNILCTYVLSGLAIKGALHCLQYQTQLTLRIGEFKQMESLLQLLLDKNVPGWTEHGKVIVDIGRVSDPYAHQLGVS